MKPIMLLAGAMMITSAAPTPAMAAEKAPGVSGEMSSAEKKRRKRMPTSSCAHGSIYERQFKPLEAISLISDADGKAFAAAMAGQVTQQSCGVAVHT